MSALAGGIELAPLLTRIAVDLDAFKTEMEKAKETAKKKSDEISKSIEKAAKVGQSMQKVGASMTKAITVPILAAGTASAKFAMDFSKDMANVRTLLNGTANETSARTKQLSADVLKVSDDVNISSSTIAEGAYQVISAYGDSAETVDLLTIAAKGAKAGGAELVETVDLMSAVTKGYGDISAEANQKAVDLAFTTVKLGQTTFPELASSVGRVIPLAANLKVSQEELFGVMATGTGVTGNAAEVSTQLRGVLQSLMAPTDTMTELMAELGYENGQAMIQGLGLQGTIDAIVGASKKSKLPLQNYIGSIEGQTIALALAGEQSDTLREKIAAMSEATGAAERAFKSATDNEGERFAASLNKMKNAAIKMGDALSPLIEKVADLIGGLADKFSEMSPEAQESAIKLAAVAAAAGPLVSVAGKGVSSIANIAGAIKGLGTAAGAGAGGLGGLTGALGGVLPVAGPVIAAVGGVALAGVAIGTALNQEVVPAVDLFETRMIDASGTIIAKGDELASTLTAQTVVISDGTKAAVGAYMDMDQQVGQILLNQQVTGGAITQETATQMVTTYNTMTDTIKTKLKEGYDTDIANMREYVTAKGLLSQEDADKAQAILSKSYEDKIAKIDAGQKRMKEIWDTAAAEHRDLTQAEEDEVNRIKDEASQMAIVELSESEAEAQAIMQTWADNHTEVTAEMAAEQVKLLNDARDEKILSAQTEYTKQMEIVKQLRADGGEEAKALADKMEAEATRQRDAVVKKAEETRDNGINELKKAYGDLEEDVDTNTGEILTYWGRLKKWWDENSFLPKKARVQIEESHTRVMTNPAAAASGSYSYTGLSYVPYDGYNIIAHKGERVLTAEENREYMQNGAGPSGSGEVAVYTQINLDGKEIGYAVAPHVSVQQAREARRR